MEPPVPNAIEGLTEWQGKQFDPALRSALRIVPDGVMEGFFVCRVAKLESTDLQR